MPNLADGLAAVDLPGEEEVQRGQSLLARISTEVVQTFKEYYSKGPLSAKSYCSTCSSSLCAGD
jgi:hypothetical protein